MRIVIPYGVMNTFSHHRAAASDVRRQAHSQSAYHVSLVGLPVRSANSLTAGLPARFAKSSSVGSSVRSATSSHHRLCSYQLDCDGRVVEVTRKAMKNMRLKVSPTGKVSVSAPFQVSDADIKRMVSMRSEWIDKQQAYYQNSLSARIEAATSEEQQQWRAVVSACVPALIETWEPILGVKAKSLVYRNMKSRWGSCQPSTGRICINTRLALYPPECLEYVVVHELCHLLVSNHGADFKGLLDRVMPDWKLRAKKLRS